MTRGAPPAPVQPASTTSASASLRRVILNAASLLGAYVLPRAFTFVAVVVAARVLGPGTFGAYGTAAATAVILSILATLGMMPLLVRELARAPERAPELISAAHLVKAGSAALMLLALPAIARFGLGYPTPVVAAAFLLGVAYAVGAFVENLGAYFQAIERMHVWMQASALYGLVTGALGALLVWSTGSVVWFCAAPIGGQLAALAWLLVRGPPSLRRASRVGADDAIRFARSLLPFAGAFIALTVFYKVDVLLLARWRPAEDVGAYVAAYKFVDVVHALVLAGVAAVYPRLSRHAPASGPRERWAATRVSELLVLVTVPAAATVWLLRSELVRGLYGEAFAAGIPLLALLAPAIPALALNLLAGYVLAATGRMGLAAAGYAAGMAVKVGLNAVLIPRMGAEGAALAMLLSEVFLAVGFLTALRVAAGAAPETHVLRLAGAAAALAVAGALLAPALPGGGAAALYAAGVVLLYRRGGALRPGEWQMLRAAFRTEPMPGARGP